MSRIGEKVRFLRKKQGLSTRQLGNKLEVTGSYLNRIENGLKRPSIDLVERMSRYFGVTTDQLIKNELEVE